MLCIMYLMNIYTILYRWCPSFIRDCGHSQEVNPFEIIEEAPIGAAADGNQDQHLNSENSVSKRKHKDISLSTTTGIDNNNNNSINRKKKKHKRRLKPHNKEKSNESTLENRSMVCQSMELCSRGNSGDALSRPNSHS